MKVILLEDVKNVGKKGDVIDAKDGYVRNFLIPKKLAVEANKLNMQELERIEKHNALTKQNEINNAESIADKLKDVNIIIKVKAGEAGKLFGSVTNKEIATSIFEQTGIEIDRKKIVLDEPLKNIGTSKVKIKLHQKVDLEVDVTLESIS